MMLWSMSLILVVFASQTPVPPPADIAATALAPAVVVQPAIISSPEKCLQKKSFPCIVLTKGKNSLQVDGQLLHLSSNALLSFSAPREFQIVRGMVWGIAKLPIKFKSTFAHFETHEPTEYWLTASKESTAVRVFFGEIEATPRGGASHWISAGKEVRASAVNFATRSCFISNPMVIDMFAYVRDFSRVFPFGTASVEDHLNSVAKTVLTASSEDSELLRQSVSRQLASDIAKEARLKVERAKASALEIYLRRLFKIKSNFEDQ